MHRSILRFFLVTVLFGSALPLWAQPTTGPSPTFRRGGEWQHGIDKAEEAEKRLRLEIDSYDHDEWIRHALAWIRYETGSDSIVIDRSHRVGDVDAGKKAEVAKRGDGDGPSWHVAYDKKAPKLLTLTLTDRGRTQVNCRFRDAGDGAGLWGVFQDPETTYLHCFWRAAPERTATVDG